MMPPDQSPVAMDDRRLLAAWLGQRDQSAFAALCDRHAALVAGACRRLASPDADEAVQAVFIVLARRPQAVGDATRLAGWLLGVARRVVAHQRRATTRRYRHEQGAAVDQQRMHTAQAAMDWEEARALLDEGLAQLTAARREAVVRFHLQGRTQAQVAQELGCSIAAVKTRVHEGLEKLRDFLARNGVTMSLAALSGGLASESVAAESTAAQATAQAHAQAALGPTSATSTDIAQRITNSMTISTAASITSLAACALLVAAIGLATAASSAEAKPIPYPSRPAASVAAGVDPGGNAALDWWRAFHFLPKDDAPIWNLANDAQSRLPDAVADSAFSTRLRSLDFLALGARGGYCAWGIDVGEEKFSALVPHVSDMQKLSSLALLRARWRTGRGEKDGAVDDLLTVLRAARLFSGLTPILIEVHVAYSIETKALTAISRLAPSFDHAHRQRLANALVLAVPMNATALAMDQEIIGAFAVIQDMHLMTPEARKSFISSIGKGENRIESVSDADVDAFIAQYHLESMRWQKYLRLPLAQRVAPLAPPPGSANALIRLISPQIDQINLHEIRLIIRRAQLRAALAVLDGGEQTLAAHPDPLTGKPFIRHGSATSFRLSSYLPGQHDPCELIVGEADLSGPEKSIGPPVKAILDRGDANGF